MTYGKLVLLFVLFIPLVACQAPAKTEQGISVALIDRTSAQLDCRFNGIACQRAFWR